MDTLPRYGSDERRRLLPLLVVASIILHLVVVVVVAVTPWPERAREREPRHDIAAERVREVSRHIVDERLLALREQIRAMIAVKRTMDDILLAQNDDYQAASAAMTQRDPEPTIASLGNADAALDAVAAHDVVDVLVRRRNAFADLLIERRGDIGDRGDRLKQEIDSLQERVGKNLNEVEQRLAEARQIVGWLTPSLAEPIQALADRQADLIARHNALSAAMTGMDYRGTRDLRRRVDDLNHRRNGVNAVQKDIQGIERELSRTDHEGRRGTLEERLQSHQRRLQQFTEIMNRSQAQLTEGIAEWSRRRDEIAVLNDEFIDQLAIQGRELATFIDRFRARAAVADSAVAPLAAEPLTQTARDLGSRGFSATYDAAAAVEGQVVDVFRRIRGVELSMLRQIALEEAIAYIDVPRPSRRDFDALVLDGTPETRAALEKQKKAIAAALEEVERMRAFCDDLLERLQTLREQLAAARAAAMVQSPAEMVRAVKRAIAEASDNETAEGDADQAAQEYGADRPLREDLSQALSQARQESEQAGFPDAEVRESMQMAAQEALEQSSVGDPSEAMLENLGEGAGEGMPPESAMEQSLQDQLAASAAASLATAQAVDMTALMQNGATVLAGPISGNEEDKALLRSDDPLAYTAFMEEHYREAVQGRYAVDRSQVPALDGRQRDGIVRGRRIAATGGSGGGDWLAIDTWWVIGPWDNPNRSRIFHTFPPEHVVDLDATYVGKDGRALSWTWWQADHHHPARVAPPERDVYAVYYFYSEVWCDQAMDLWLASGSDDLGKLWVNDFLVFKSAPWQQNWRMDQGFRKVHFKQGVNRLLYRLENGHGGTEMSLVISLAPTP